MIYEVGDTPIVKGSFDSKNFDDRIRALAGKPVTIRALKTFNDFRKPGYYIKETEGLDCDDMWYFDDFEDGD